MKLLIGLMSGTSMDGIDAALIDVDTNTLIKGVTRPYSGNVRRQLTHLMTNQTTTPATISQLNHLIGHEFAKAVHQLLDLAKVSHSDVVAIGSHGQTVCHDAFADIPYTLQLGCAHTIAVETKITVVADFRTRDLVLKGQGAPFAPIYHKALFETLNAPIAVVNIGGIANVTYLSQDGRVFGYDVGPGNCLMDAWVKKHTDNDFDADGAWAKMGVVNLALMKDLLSDPFFQLSPPKSIGKEYFSATWLEQYVQNEINPRDVQATLLALTAQCIANDIRMNKEGVERVLLCGGGVHNDALYQLLKQYLQGIDVDSTAVLGVDPDYIEAMMLAWLAEQTLNGRALDLTQITGAKNASILGAVYPV